MRRTASEKLINLSKRVGNLEKEASRFGSLNTDVSGQSQMRILDILDLDASEVSLEKTDRKWNGLTAISIIVATTNPFPTQRKFYFLESDNHLIAYYTTEREASQAFKALTSR